MELLTKDSPEYIKNEGVDVSNHSWIFIAKYGIRSYVTLEAPLTVPYISGKSFTCVMDSRGLVQDVLEY